MDDGADQGGAAAAPGGSRAGAGGVVRKLLDINTFYEGDGSGWRWFVARFVLFAIGSVVGGVLWGIVNESAGDRGFAERLVTNVYLWASLVATGLYALYDRWVARQRAGTD